MNFIVLVCNAIVFAFSDVFSWFKRCKIRASYKALGVFVSRDVTVKFSDACVIQLSRGVSVGKGTLLLCTNEMAESSRKTTILRVGPNTSINEYCNIRACGGDITIGGNCIVAQFVTIVASNHSTLKQELPMKDQLWADSPSGITIENDVWLGANSIVLPGVKIGEGAVIAAGAVVTSNVGSYEIWAGVPARFIRFRK